MEVPPNRHPPATDFEILGAEQGVWTKKNPTCGFLNWFPLFHTRLALRIEGTARTKRASGWQGLVEMSPSPLHVRLDVWGGAGGLFLGPKRMVFLQFPFKTNRKRGAQEKTQPYIHSFGIAGPSQHRQQSSAHLPKGPRNEGH